MIITVCNVERVNIAEQTLGAVDLEAYTLEILRAYMYVVARANGYIGGSEKVGSGSVQSLRRLNRPLCIFRCVPEHETGRTWSRYEHIGWFAWFSRCNSSVNAVVLAKFATLFFEHLLCFTAHELSRL